MTWGKKKKKILSYICSYYSDIPIIIANVYQLLTISQALFKVQILIYSSQSPYNIGTIIIPFYV